ncbi:Sexual differentiation process protein isp4 [Venturia nashicola]|uniref:Sexual differentiation process protein isp4 n=1 Tax=Venturia nashicola TaxID=86259 RepID=A0A4Z1P4E4_9PEZI|nr:Sexual differentiation process protein isp4 [Venturia nashicola]
MGQTDSEFIELTTVFMPGRPPAVATGSLFVWPGLFDQKNRSDGDLVQTVAEFHSPIERQRKSCDANPGQWCIRPFIVSHGYVSQTVPVGLSIDGTDQIKINYKKAPGDNGQWTQTLWNLSHRNQQLFSYVKGSAACKWFEIATESQEGNKGSADIQNYYNTTLVLKNPDPKLGSKFSKTGSITTTNPITSDGGKTWFIQKITVPPMLPPGQEFKPPPPAAPAPPAAKPPSPPPAPPQPPPAAPPAPQPAPVAKPPPPAPAPPQPPPAAPQPPPATPPAPQPAPAVKPPPPAPAPPQPPPAAPQPPPPAPPAPQPPPPAPPAPQPAPAAKPAPPAPAQPQAAPPKNPPQNPPQNPPAPPAKPPPPPKKNL